MLVRMQTEWGAVNDLYDSSSANSLFTAQPVPPYIRDPDSSFSMSWDLVQVPALPPRPAPRAAWPGMPPQ